MGKTNESLDIWGLFDIPSIEAGGVEAYLKTILLRCADWFEAKAASVFVAEDDGVIRCQAAIGTTISPHATITEGQGIAGSALLYGKAMVIADPADNPILAGQVSAKREDIGSAMVIPLISNGRKLGVLNLARSEKAPAFNETDLAKANTLGTNISLAVANWRMLGEIKSASDQITTVFNLLDVAILTIKGGNIFQRNHEASRLFDDSSYQNLLMNLPRAFSDAINQAVAEAEAGHTVRIQKVNDHQTWTINASPLPDGGALLVVEDITAAMQATQELSRVRRLAEIGQMTAAIAHEIRNPLTGIRSAAQLIASAPDQCEELAKMIEDEAIKLNDLCTQFLEFAKPVEPVFATTELESMALRMTAVHSAEFEQANIVLEIKANHPCIVQVDKNQIEQVMRNLVINALHATSRGGRVTIEILDRGFAVHDTGSGMDEDTVRNLFMPFFTTKPKGTGLGLSNCRKIVEAHGGSIEVKSSVGEGSSFVVTFADHIKVAA